MRGGSMITAPMEFGMLASFRTTDAVVQAAAQARAQGYTRMDAYTPFHVHGLAEALGAGPTRLPWVVLGGGIVGGLVGYGLQYFASAVDYPLDVGGRPLHSWPSFLPVTFELAILFAAVSAVVGMLAMNGLPRPYHPLFNAPSFALASRDRFFLCIESGDPAYDRDRVRRFLESLGADEVIEVPP